MPRCGSLVSNRRQALWRPSYGLAALDFAHAVVGGGPTVFTSSSSSERSPLLVAFESPPLLVAIRESTAVGGTN